MFIFSKIMNFIKKFDGRFFLESVNDVEKIEKWLWGSLVEPVGPKYNGFIMYSMSKRRCIGDRYTGV